MTGERAYREMASLTRNLCDRVCNDQRPFRCCEAFYCEQAMAYAKQRGVELKPTGHATIPLMDAQNRCTAPAHLRPTCSAHHCDINSMGFFKPRPVLPASEARKATARYFRLRERAGADLDIDAETSPC